MKLEQEQLKKIGVCAAALAALLYGYFAFLLGPLEDEMNKSLAGIATLEPQISGAKQQIAKTAALEKIAPNATALLTNLKNTIPDGAPIAWFPPKMSNFFKSRGIDKASTHLVAESDDALPGFHKMVWSIDLPKVEFVPLGMAIATLENNEPLMEILNVSIDATREDAQYQHVTLVVSTLVKS